jgi:poly-gamma-glutamate capsule biosynthesis protein CapA/YwtB (metallophosphatase superfamily)
MVPRGLLALLLLAAALVGAIVWVTTQPRSAQAQEPPTVRVTSALPAWVAPRARIRFRGRATPGATVRVIIGSRGRGRVVTGPRGRFSLVVRAPRYRGRYQVAVAAGATRVNLGRLVVRPLVLAAVGDVNLGDAVGTAIARHGARYPWLSVARVLRSADLAVANLECAVSTRGAPWPGKQYTFRGKPSSLRAAGRFAGVDAVSLANNHSLDYGRAAFRDTLANARRFGIAPFGGGRDIVAARRAAVLRRGNLRVAFVGFSDVRPLGFDAGPGLSGAAPAFPEHIRAGVRAARRRADVVVAYFHWGIERSTVPSSRQHALAQTALDAGAKVVLGAHPHVLQPIVRRGKRRLVAWSLGNFVFAAFSPGTERTGILRVSLGADGVRGWRFRRARIHGVQPRLVS